MEVRGSKAQGAGGWGTGLCGGGPWVRDCGRIVWFPYSFRVHYGRSWVGVHTVGGYTVAAAGAYSQYWASALVCETTTKRVRKVS